MSTPARRLRSEDERLRRYDEFVRVNEEILADLTAFQKRLARHLKDLAGREIGRDPRQRRLRTP
jgi:hypothetical protein